VSLPAFANEPTLELRAAPNRNLFAAALADLDARLPLEVPVLIGTEHGAAGVLYSTDPGKPDRVVASTAAAGASEVDAAVSAAVSAAPAWAGLEATERARILVGAAAIMREWRLELAALEVRECAKPWAEADADVCEAIDFLEYYARSAVELGAGRTLLQAPGERNTMRYVARGVTAVVAPWNFPLAIPTGMTAAALATGNAVILKPAEQSPGCGLRLVEALRAAGVPAGVIALLPGEGATGAALVCHPRIDTIAFTGSSVVGLEIMRSALESSSGRLKRVVAEMGGKNCVIVDADVDLDEAIPEIIYSAFGYAGQKCSACSRILVHEHVAADLQRRLTGAVASLAVGQAEDFGTDVPPLIDAAAQSRLARYEGLARTQGRILARADAPDAPGWFSAPVVAGELPPDSPILAEEIFGPLVTLEPVKSVTAACETIDALPFALTAGIFSRNPATVTSVAARLPTGNLYVNRHITGALVGRQPFGGNRLSGVGSKAGGPDYLLQFVEPRVVSENTMRHGLPLS
jgi:RHH-type proline utilization regulon transcriptional repressor/proline dehydrogenase/delta 1-pyrroline-5-carboxylate dehydrogenase